MTEDKTRNPLPRDDHPKQNPVDDTRTARAHAGEAITDARNWPGYFLMVLGLASLGLTLVAAADGFEGWSMIGVVAVVVFFAAGFGAVLFERKRVKAREGKSLTDPGGH